MKISMLILGDILAIALDHLHRLCHARRSGSLLPPTHGGDLLSALHFVVPPGSLAWTFSTGNHIQIRNNSGVPRSPCSLPRHWLLSCADYPQRADHSDFCGLCPWQRLPRLGMVVWRGLVFYCIEPQSLRSPLRASFVLFAFVDKFSTQ